MSVRVHFLLMHFAHAMEFHSNIFSSSLLNSVKGD